MPPVLRILDANANRAREALRVMEESARFLLNSAELTEELKTLRHGLADALSTVQGLPESRDTPGDVGTQIATAAEASRGSVADVVTAACKRLTEALRALEEYGKTLPPQACNGPTFAARIEALRYRAYEAERRLNLAAGSGRAKQWRLCLLLTQSLCIHHAWEDVLRTSLDAGLDCVQVREKALSGRALLEHVEAVMGVVDRRASVIVNDRPDIALAAGADGVHLGQKDLPVEAARKLVGRQLIIGVSCRDTVQAESAFAGGADYVGLGPMFATTTVDDKPDVVGPAFAREFVTVYPGRPHLAIGGITPRNAGEVVGAGARGLAVSSAVCGAENPGAVVGALLEAVGAH